MDIRPLIDALRIVPPVSKLKDGREVLLVPDGYKAEFMPVAPPLPERVIARRAFHDGDSLAAYVNRFKGPESLLIADVDARTISVALDYHRDPVEPAAVAHVASWEMQCSQEYRQWESFEGKLHEQAEFIRFLEENVMDVHLPDPAKLLDLCRDFEAIKTVNFKASRRLDNGDREFTYAESTGTADRIAVPQKLVINIPIFHREESQELHALFRYRMREGGLQLGYEFHRLKHVFDAAFRVAAVRVAESCGLPAHFGKVTW